MSLRSTQQRNKPMYLHGTSAATWSAQHMQLLVQMCRCAQNERCLHRIVAASPPWVIVKQQAIRLAHAWRQSDASPTVDIFMYTQGMLTICVQHPVQRTQSALQQRTTLAEKHLGKGRQHRTPLVRRSHRCKQLGGRRSQRSCSAV